MAYNPYNDVSAIYGLKGEWEKAKSEGNDKKKSEAEKKAKSYYESLKNNGYSTVASELGNADYSGAKSIYDKWAKTGKTPVREYFYSLGKAYGMQTSDVDKLIGWDGDTGEISFGGKKIGKPDTVVDGVSYASDVKTLDNAFNDYIKRSGTVRSKASAVNQENENLFKKYNQEYEDLKATNPFKTEEAKSILAKYDLLGLQGRDNAIASTAGTNGGNIDSFAAANALRQQSSLINQGQQAVLEAYNSKLEHARALLSDMGVNIERVYNEDETSKNNDVTRKAEIAAVSGYTPDEWTASFNPYLNDDGSLKAEYKNVDFSEVMKNAKKAGNTAAYNAAAVARYYKIMGDYSTYGKFDDGNYKVPEREKTADVTLSEKQLESAERIASGENETNLTLADKTAKSAIDQIKAETEAEKELLRENGEGTDVYGNATYKNGVKVGDKNGKPILSYASAKEMYEAGNTSEQVMYALSYFGEDLSEEESGKNYEKKLNAVYDNSSKTVKEYIRSALIPMISEKSITEEDLKRHLLENSEEYNIKTDDIREICRALGVDAMWVDDYKNASALSLKKGVIKA